MDGIANHDTSTRVPLLWFKFGTVIEAVFDQPLCTLDHFQHNWIPIPGLQHLPDLTFLGCSLSIVEEPPSGFLPFVSRQCQPPRRLVMGDGIANDMAQLPIPISRTRGIAKCLRRGRDTGGLFVFSALILQGRVDEFSYLRQTRE